MDTVQGYQGPLVDDFSAQSPAGLTETSSSNATNSQQGINFRPLLRTVRRNALLILGATALIAGVAYWRSTSALPVYQGNFRLLVEPVTPERSLAEPGTVTRGQERPRQTELDYATQLVILQSSRLLSDVVDQVQAVYPDFNEGTLREGLTVQRCCTGDGVGGMGGTNTGILEIVYEDSDPSRVDLVLETMSNRFLQYSLEERTSNIGEGVKFIDEQLPALEGRVSSLQSQIQALQEQYLLTDPQAQGGQLSTQFVDVSNQKLEAERLLREQITLYQNIQSQLGLGPSQALASSTLSEDPGYQNLLRQREEIESEIAIESAFYNEASPVIQALLERQNEISALQERRAQQVLGPSFGELSGSQRLAYQNSIRTALIQQMVAAMNEIEVLQARAGTLDQASNALSQRLQQFPAIARRYNELQRELELATQTLDRLLTQRETLRVEVAQNEFPWDLISLSQVPVDEDGSPVPEEGKLPRNMALGLLAGMIAGTGGALLLEKSRDTFLSLGDLEEAIPLPVIATVPYCEEVPRLGDAAMATAPSGLGGRNSANLFAFAESFNAIYTKIRLLPSAEPTRSVVVSSACPGDGKSTVALNLAKAAVMADQRVLLVDANFHSPQVHQMLDLAASQGLSDVLQNKLDIDEAIRSVPHVDNLFVLTAGNLGAGTGRLLASPQMKRLADKLHNAFDLVVYDTPSFQDSSDASFLTSYSSGLLMAVGLQKTSRTAATQTISELDDFHLPCLGVVANYV